MPVTPKPLEVGIAFHKGMEQIYNPDTWADTTDQEKLDAAIATFTEICEEQRARFLKATHQTHRDEKWGDDYEERVVLGVGMLKHYMNEVHPKADKWFRPVAIEVPFSTELKYPDISKVRNLGLPVGEVMTCSNSPHCGQKHPNPAPVTLNGRVDAIVEDIAYGGYLVTDWKTAAQLIINGEFLQLDDQITSYCAALQVEFDLDIRGFMYAEFKKAFPGPIESLSRVTKGRKLSVNHQQDTSYHAAKQTMEAIDPKGLEAGFYDDYLEWLQGKEGPRYHQRFLVIQEDAKLHNVLDNIAQEALEMTDPHLPLYPSPGKSNCPGCAFRTPCLGKFNDEEYEFTLKTNYEKRV